MSPKGFVNGVDGCSHGYSWPEGGRITIPERMIRGFIFQTAQRASSIRGDMTVMEKRFGRNSILES